MTNLDETILSALRDSPEGRSAVELAEDTNTGYRDVLDALERLHADRRISLGGRLGAWAPTTPAGDQP